MNQIPLLIVKWRQDDEENNILEYFRPLLLVLSNGRRFVKVVIVLACVQVLSSMQRALDHELIEANLQVMVSHIIEELCADLATDDLRSDKILLGQTETHLL